ncbi:apoptosis regulator BAX-like isoform X2 [Trematomus bernacchii]|uniref:apoptosis regulator BAX-like isoform X2 n=1 Tax=Trematomus bernacchii TaxID=40690 RepID=UPI00146E0D50|nr:apoptosis regulator BAX-like isoform X2 [Trematomus bernacchii]
MACEVNDARIGEALIKEVIEEELKDVPSEEVPPFSPLAARVESEQEQKLVTQLAKMVCIIGDRVAGDQELRDVIDGIAVSSGSKRDNFKKVADKVFEHGITWERIAVLFYVAGKLAVKMVEAHLPESVNKILRWTVDFFKNNLLAWIRDQGGWIYSFPELAQSSMQSVSTMSAHSYGLVLIFVAGLAVGSIITWRLSRN